MKNIVAYCRVSTDNQVGENSFGIDVQKQQIIDYCQQNDLNIVDWFIDEGISGAKLDRPELQRMLSNEVTNPPVEAIIVAKSDRLARDQNLYFWLKYEMNKRGISIIAVDNDYSQFGPMGAILENLIVSFAEFERDLITTRTSKGRKVKASQGSCAGGQRPYGYNIVEGHYVINEDEAEVVRLIMMSELSLRKTAAWLNEEGFVTKSGKAWSVSQVSYIKKNRKLYEGFYKYGDMDWVQGTHRAIL